MKPTTVLTRNGVVVAGQAVVARLQRHLIGAVVRVGRQRRALAGLEVHDVRPLRLPQLQRHVLRLVEQRQRDAEAAQRLLGAGDRLEHQVELRALLQRLHLRGDVGEAAVLGRDAPLAHEVAGRVQDRRGRPGIVGDRVDADDRVAGAVRAARRAATPGCPSIESDGWFGCRRIESRPGQPDGVGRVHHDPDLPGRVDEVHVRHQLGAGRDHLAGEPARQAQQLRARRWSSDSTCSRSFATVHDFTLS